MMASVLRKARGIVGTGLTWAAAWSVGGTVIQWGLSLFGLMRTPDLMVAPLMWGLMGLYGGALFGGLLSLTEGKRTLEKLSVGRVAAWGAIAGIAAPVVYNLMRGDPGSISMMSLMTSALVLAPLSAGSAAAMTALAKGEGKAELGSEADPLAVENGPETVELLK